MDYFTLALIALATSRVVRLLTDDVILEAPRDWLILKTGGAKTPPTRTSYVWSCSWCTSVWIAAPFAYLGFAATDLTITQALLLWPALSMLAVMLLALTESWVGEER